MPQRPARGRKIRASFYPLRLRCQGSEQAEARPFRRLVEEGHRPRRVGVEHQSLDLRQHHLGDEGQGQRPRVGQRQPLQMRELLPRCLEAVAGGRAIAAELAAAGLPALTSADVVALVRSGDVTALRTVRDAGRAIGEVLATCVSMLNPSVIVLGGSVAEAGERVL